MAILTLKDLSIGYGSHAIVENINLEIKSGEFVCVIGENGSGKTTLMKTLLGLIPPISGKIIRGDKLTTHDIGYMPQISSVSLAIFWLTIIVSRLISTVFAKYPTVEMLYISYPVTWVVSTIIQVSLFAYFYRRLSFANSGFKL